MHYFLFLNSRYLFLTTPSVYQYLQEKFYAHFPCSKLIFYIVILLVKLFGHYFTHLYFKNENHNHFCCFLNRYSLFLVIGFSLLINLFIFQDTRSLLLLLQAQVGIFYSGYKNLFICLL